MAKLPPWSTTLKTLAPPPRQNPLDHDLGPKYIRALNHILGLAEMGLRYEPYVGVSGVPNGRDVAPLVLNPSGLINTPLQSLRSAVHNFLHPGHRSSRSLSVDDDAVVELQGGLEAGVPAARVGSGGGQVGQQQEGSLKTVMEGIELKQ